MLAGMMLMETGDRVSDAKRESVLAPPTRNGDFEMVRLVVYAYANAGSTEMCG
jgi:hypothetical protein